MFITCISACVCVYFRLYKFINLLYQLWYWYYLYWIGCVCVYVCVWRVHKTRVFIFIYLFFIVCYASRDMCVLRATRRYPLTGAVLYWYKNRVKLVTAVVAVVKWWRRRWKYRFSIMIIIMSFFLFIFLFKLWTLPFITNLFCAINTMTCFYDQLADLIYF